MKTKTPTSCINLTRRDCENLINPFLRWVGKNYCRRDQLGILLNYGIAPNAQTVLEDFLVHTLKVDEDNIPDYCYLLSLIEKKMEKILRHTLQSTFC